MSQRFIPSSSTRPCRFCGTERWKNETADVKALHEHAQCVAVEEPTGRFGPQ